MWWHLKQLRQLIDFSLCHFFYKKVWKILGVFGMILHMQLRKIVYIFLNHWEYTKFQLSKLFFNLSPPKSPTIEKCKGYFDGYVIYFMSCFVFIAIMKFLCLKTWEFCCLIVLRLMWFLHPSKMTICWLFLWNGKG